MAYFYIPHFWDDTTGLPFGQGITKIEQESGVPLGKMDGPCIYPDNWINLTNSPALNRIVVKALLASPVSYAKWHLYNSLGFFINPAVGTPNPSINLKLQLAHGRVMEVLRDISTPWWFFLERLSLLLGFIFASIGVWKLRKEKLTWVFVFIILYVAALGGASSQARYRLPVEPFLSIFIVTGISLILEKFRNSRFFRQFITHGLTLRMNGRN
jgi:hypothetical protein